MHLPATDRADGEDVEPRREDDREDERRACTRTAEHKREYGEHYSEKRRGDSGELWALAEGSGNKEGPTGEREAEQKMDDDNEPDIRRCEDAEMPDDSYDDPCREICKGDANVPRTASMNP